MLRGGEVAHGREVETIGVYMLKESAGEAFEMEKYPQGAFDRIG